ncbi:hypothetical protein DRF59_05285 [Chryseobacterium flavum]|uniref:Uncharacterized protein n=1 Tax=Chryseobacterium flavum TaxID=415851 RepID=A0A3D9CRR7_9FLAO|nr:hypothetical protein [Chryseobacterium flavum]REC68452.1 hypothetical protein DRF59_05285 [Chryseobacterium flavum]
MKTNALFFQLNTQKTVNIIYAIIRTGKPKESKLNHGNILGGIYAFIKEPNSRNKIPRCSISIISRKTFTK